MDWLLAFTSAVLPVVAAQRLAVTVHLVNNVNAPSAELRSARIEAGLIFQRAGIDIHWVECLPTLVISGSEPACGRVNHPLLFVLSINGGVPPDGSPTSLGYALMPGYCNHAAALYPRIENIVKNHPEYSRASVLGSVLAHELGHLFYRSTEHSHGVMRANWEHSDFLAMSQRRLGFCKKQAEKLRQTLAERIASSGGAPMPRIIAGLR
jgi:hypothetical protein